MLEEKVLKIHLKNSIVTLKTIAKEEINSEDLIKIDYSNLIGELLTFSVIINRLGNLRAEVEELWNLYKLESEILKAELENHYRIFLKKQLGKDPYQPQIDAKVRQDQGLIKQKKEEYRIQKEFGYVDSLYWAAKSKDDKLNAITKKINPEEFEQDILEGEINGIFLKKHKKLIKKDN